MEKSASGFVVMDIILFVLLLSFILVTFDLGGVLFLLELILLLGFIIMLVFGMSGVYNARGFGWIMLAVTLVVMFFDLIFVFIYRRKFDIPFITASLFSIFGIILALVFAMMESGKGRKPEEHVEKGPKAYYPYTDEAAPEEESPEVAENIEKATKSGKETKVETKFTPGKYVASKNAKKFHSAKCDWAKKISKSNSIWFDSKEGAVAKGFEAHDCIE